MSKNKNDESLFDQIGKMKDPLGIYDFDGDGHYDTDEFLILEEDEQREIDEWSKRKSGTSLDEDEDDEDDEDCSDDGDSSFEDDTLEDVDDYGDGDEGEEDEEENEWGEIETGNDGGGCEIEITISVSTSDTEADEDEQELTPMQERCREAKEMLPFIKGRDKESVLERKRCRLILAGDTFVSKYCDYTYGFRHHFVEAYMDNVGLPEEFIEHYGKEEFIFDFMNYLAEYDTALALDAWRWMMEKFLPYAEYDEEGMQSLVGATFGYLEDKPEDFPEKAIDYFNEHFDLFEKMVEEVGVPLLNLDEYIFEAMDEGRFALGIHILDIVIRKNKGSTMAQKIDMIESLEGRCLYSDNPYPAAGFSKLIITILRWLDNKILNKKLDKWKKELDERVDEIVDTDERYAYALKNQWRVKYKDGELDPTKYDSEEAYLKALDERNKVSEVEKDIERLINDVESSGIYADAADEEKKFFEFAFKEKKSSYAILCETLLKREGDVREIGNGYLLGNVSTADIEQLYMFISTTHEWHGYMRTVIHPSEATTLDVEISKVNRPIMEYAMSRIRPLKMMYLEEKAHYLGAWDDLLKKARGIWRDSEISIRKVAKKRYADALASSEIKHKWVSEQRMLTVIKTRYTDAIYQYAPDWLEGQSIDVFVPSLHAAFEYQGVQHYQATEIFGGEEGLKKVKERDAVKRQKCEARGIRVVDWMYYEPIDDETLDKKIKELSDKID